MPRPHVFRSLRIIVFTIVLRWDVVRLAGDPSHWEKMMALNVLAPMRLTHHFGNHFVKRGSGVIINIDSVAGINPMGPQAAYVASKHAITGWTESVAQVQRTVSLGS